MKYMLLCCASMIIAFSFCRYDHLGTYTSSVEGSEFTLDFQQCAYLSDHDITICFIDAQNDLCACDVLCVWEGLVSGTFQIKTASGIDTTIALVTNSSPQYLNYSDTIGGKIIRFWGIENLTCANWHNYETFKAKISVE